MKSWIISSISSIILFTTISYIGHFYTYWTEHSKEYTRASVFIKTETCTNPRVRSQLGDFNLCDRSETILSQPPIVAALFDVARDLSICGNNRCSVFYIDITKNLFKVLVGAVVLAILGVWAGVLDLKHLWEERVINHYTLPIKRKIK